MSELIQYTRVHTISGSTYEIDHHKRRVRRRGPSTAKRATERWKTYETISDPVPGDVLTILWPSTEPLLPGSPACAVPATKSSVILFVEADARVSP